MYLRHSLKHCLQLFLGALITTMLFFIVLFSSLCSNPVISMPGLKPSLQTAQWETLKAMLNTRLQAHQVSLRMGQVQHKRSLDPHFIFNKSIHVLVGKKLPFLEVSEGDEEVQITGYVGDLWRTLEEILGFRTIYHKMLVKDARIALRTSMEDMVLVPVVMKACDLKIYRHTMPLTTIWYRIFMRKNNNDGDSTFYFSIWRSYLRNAYMASLIVLTVFLWISLKAIKYSMTLERTHCSRKINRRKSSSDTSIVNCFLSVLGVLLNQGVQVRTLQCSTRIILLLATILGFVGITSYSAVLISKLAIVEPTLFKNPLDTIKNEKSHTICTSETGFAYDYFLKKSSNNIKDSWKGIINGPPCSVGQKDLVPASDYCSPGTVVLETMENCYAAWNEESANCSFFALPDRYYYSYLSLLARKDFPFTNLISEYLLKLHSSGILMKLQNQNLPKKFNHVYVTEDDYSIQFCHISGILVLYVYAIVLSLVILLLEVIAHRRVIITCYQQMKGDKIM